MASKKTTPRKSAKKKSRYPVLSGFELTDSGATSTTRIIQVDRELSKVNHRLYRMMRYYECKIDMNPQSTDGQVDIYVLKDTWSLHKAVQMAYKEYLENTSDERSRMSSTARWEDFRADHGIPAGTFGLAVAGLRNNVGALTSFTAGEFELSKVVDASNVTQTFTFGPTSGATELSILAEYDSTDNAQATPDSIPGTGGYDNLHSNLDDAVSDGLRDDGNLPPYNQNSLSPTHMWVRVATIGTGAGGVQKLSTGFFTAPAGIIVMRGVDTTNYLNLTVKNGDYKGVHAPSMLE